MPLFSRLHNDIMIDLADHHLENTDVIFPLEYHDLFRQSLDLVDELKDTRCDGRPSASHLRVDPGIFRFLIALVVDVIRRLARASYGGNCLPGTIDLREGALTELGVSDPPIYQFIRLFRDHQPFFGGSFVHEDKFDDWVDWFLDAVEGTRTWILDARHIAATQPSGWNWGPLTMNANIVDALGYDPRDPYFPLGVPWRPEQHSLTVIPHPVTGPGAQNSMVLYQPPFAPNEPVDHARSQCLDLIPHPILGPGAQHAVVPYHPFTHAAQNTCTDLIPHPVLGRGARNELVLYRAPRFPNELQDHASIPAYEDPTYYEVDYEVEFDENSSEGGPDEQYFAQGFVADV